MSTLIKHCRIVSPDVDVSGVSIEIDGDYIKRIYTASEPLPAADKVYDVKGKIAVPGFIDIHTHGASGSDVVDGTVEAITKIAETKVKEGVTSFLPTTLTLGEARLTKSMEAVAAYQKNPDSKGAKIPGVHLEGPFINAKCAGAQNPDFVRKPDIDEVLRLDKIAKVSIISFAVESEGGYDFTSQLVSNGIVPSCGHSAATHEQFKYACNAGLKHLTHFCNQMSPLHHREIGLVGSGLMDNQVTIEVICDKTHLCPDMVKLIFALKPIDKIALITDSLLCSWLPDGEFNLGGLAFKVDKGVARLASNGALAGSTLRYYQGLKNISELTGLPLKQLIKTTSYNQARSLNLNKNGKIEVGYFADIAVLDDEFNPVHVFVNGKQKL